MPRGPETIDTKVELQPEMERLFLPITAQERALLWLAYVGPRQNGTDPHGKRIRGKTMNGVDSIERYMKQRPSEPMRRFLPPEPSGGTRSYAVAWRWKNAQ